MSVRIQVPVVIDRPLEDVFHFYAHEHVRNHPRWDPDMHLEQISNGPIVIGTIIRRRSTHSGMPVDGTMEVVEFGANKAFAVLIHDGSSVTHGRVTFDSIGQKQTRLTIHSEFTDMDESMESGITGMVERPKH